MCLTAEYCSFYMKRKMKEKSILFTFDKIKLNLTATTKKSLNEKEAQ